MFEYRVGDLVRVANEYRIYLITKVMPAEDKCVVKYIHGNPKTEVGKRISFGDIERAIDHFDVTR